MQLALLTVRGTLGQIVPSNPTSQTSFASQYNSHCGGSSNTSTACQEYLYNITSEHYRYTDYMSREDSAVEDAVEGAEKDWSFIVNQLNLLSPKIRQFKASNQTTKQSLINQLQANVTNFVNQVNPVLEWENRAFGRILAADSNDSYAFMQQLDAAVTRVLTRAMNASDLSPQNPSQFVLNSSRYLDDFYASQFRSANSTLVAKQLDMLSELAALMNQTSFYRNFLLIRANQLMQTGSSEGANVNVVLPQAISQSQALLSQSLSRMINQFLTAGNMSADVASQLGKFNTFSTGQLALFSTQFNESLDGVASTIYANLNRTLATADAGATAAINLFNQSESSFYSQWLAITNALANMSSSQVQQNATQYLVKDSELGADSLINFNQVAGNITALLDTRSSGIDRDRLNNASSSVSNFASSVMSDLNSKMNQLLIPGAASAVPALNEWENFAALTTNSTLPEIKKHFRSGVEGVQDTVFDQVGSAVDALNGDSNGVSRVLKGDNFSSISLNQSELNSFISEINRFQSDAREAISGAISSLSTGLNSTGKSLEVDADASASLSVLSNLATTFESSLQLENQTDSELLAQVDATQVKAPANVELANYAINQEAIGNISNRQVKLTNRLLNDAPLEASAAQMVATLVSGIDAAAGARADRLSDIISNLIEASAKNIKTKTESFIRELPVATGFQAAANERANSLEQMKSWISNTATETANHIQTGIGSLTNYKSGIQGSFEKLKAAQTAISQRQSIQSPDFSSLNEAVKSRVDSGAVLSQFASDLSSQIYSETKSFNAKEMEVGGKISAEKKISSQRINQIATDKSDFDSSNSTAEYFLTEDQSRIDSLSRTLSDSLNATNLTLSALGPANREEANALSQLFSNLRGDLNYQLKESAPAFLAQMETENITQKLLPALQALNKTVSAINFEASFSSSLLDRHAVADASKKVKEIVGTLSDRESVRKIRKAIDSLVKKIEANIALHVPINADFSVSETVDPEASGFADAALGVIQRLDARRAGSVESIDRFANATWANLDDQMAQLLLNIKQDSSILKSVLAEMNFIEAKDVKNLRSQVKRKLRLARDSVSGVARLATLVLNNKGRSSSFDREYGTRIGIPKKMTPNFGESSRLESAKEWVVELMNSMADKLESRTSNQFEQLNESLKQIDSMQQSLRKLAKTEAKIESDFDSKILSKLKRVTSNANRTVEDLFADISHDLVVKNDSLVIEELKKLVNENRKLLRNKH